MPQRIFDVDNPQDVKDLFDILPDDTRKIIRADNVVGLIGNGFTLCNLIRIAWHDKKEITRPVDESKWIGCLCWFVDGTGNEYIGVLHATRNGDDSYPYICKNGLLRSFKNCRPVRRNEIKFVEDVE